MAKILRACTFLTVTVVVTCTMANLLFGLWMCRSDIVDFIGVEQNVVYATIKLLKTGSLYTDTTQAPFDITQYSPLYYLVCARIARIGGVSPDQVASISSTARAVSYASSVVLLAIVYFFATRALHASRTFAIIFSGTAFVICCPWLFLARPDTLYCLCLFASIALAFVAVETTNSQRERDLCTVLCGAFTAAALLSKQSAIQIPLIILPFLAIRGEWRRLALLMGSTVLFLVLCIVVVASALGQDLWANMVVGIQNPIWLKAAFIRTYHLFFSQLSLPLACGVLISIDWLANRSGPGHLLQLWTMWGLFLFASFTGLKAGSDDHYYNEFILVWAALAAAYFTRLRDVPEEVRWNTNRVTLVVLCFLIFFLPFRTAYCIGKYGTDVDIIYNTYGSRKEVAEYLREKMAGRPGSWVFTEDHVLALFLPDSGLFPQPDVIGVYPLREQAFKNFRELVSAGRVAYVVCSRLNGRQPYFPQIPAGFRLERKIGGYSIYRYEMAEDRRKSNPRSNADEEASWKDSQ